MLRPSNLSAILYSVNLTDPYRSPSGVALWIAATPWACSLLTAGTVIVELSFAGVPLAPTNRARAVFVTGAAAFLVGAAWWLHLPQPIHLLALLICLDWGALAGRPEPRPW
ncbi:MAG TPA: hypothetical protein PKA64_18795 [Myxococcota bacterium]|nr:hypothetical protein [Myxococcota bacterium]